MEEEISGMTEHSQKRDSTILFSFQLLLVALFALFVCYDKEIPLVNARSEASTKPPFHHFQMFEDMQMMLLLGFGLLMTFLSKYSWSAVGFNFLLSAVTLQWAIICQGLFSLNSAGKINLNMTRLIGGDTVTASVLISLGAVLGKTTPMQLLSMAVLEVATFAINEVLLQYLQILDTGGSVLVHVFGAYFGLSISRVLGRPKNYLNEVSSYQSDIFSVIGTLFLWIYWPSFNAALSFGAAQNRAVINTCLALTASTIAAFATSQLYASKHKFNMVHVQNATLAGGVAVGMVASLLLLPYTTLIIGMVAGTVSVIGFSHIQPWLLVRLKVHDTCGVHNLHGLPGLLGGLAGSLFSFLAHPDDYAQSMFPARVTNNSTEDFAQSLVVTSGLARTAGSQALFQLLAIVLTLVLAISGGLLTGILLKLPIGRSSKANEMNTFNDALFWELSMSTSVNDTSHD